MKNITDDHGQGQDNSWEHDPRIPSATRAELVQRFNQKQWTSDQLHYEACKALAQRLNELDEHLDKGTFSKLPPRHYFNRLAMPLGILRADLLPYLQAKIRAYEAAHPEKTQ